jgi:hypothetical protein
MEEKTESAATVAMVAGLIAAVRLARVDSEELIRRSPRVRCAIYESPLVLGCKRAKMHLICQLRGITDVQAPNGRRAACGE